MAVGVTRGAGWLPGETQLPLVPSPGSASLCAGATRLSLLLVAGALMRSAVCLLRVSPFIEMAGLLPSLCLHCTNPSQILMFDDYKYHTCF